MRGVLVMQERSIYSFFSEEAAAKYQALTQFTLTERSKALYKQGEPGQGFVYFLDVETGEIDLIPAYNKNDGRERKEFIYEGKNWAVESSDELGKSSGDAHTKALALLKKNNPEKNRMIVAGGIFMGENYLAEEIRNKSASKNILTIVYSEEYLLSRYRPFVSKHGNLILNTQRSIPGDITMAVVNELREQLPFRAGADNQIRKIRSIDENIARDAGYMYDIPEQIRIENKFKSMSDENLKHLLIKNMFTAAMHNDVDIVVRILKLDLISIDHKDKLIESIKSDSDHLSICQKVFSSFDVNQPIGSLDDTALTTAITNGSIEMVKMLLTIDQINVNKANGLGDTPLAMAMKAGQIEMIKILLVHKDININEKNFIKETLLFWAAKNGKEEITKLLLAAGADPDLARFDGRKPIDIARENNFTDVVDILENKNENLATPTPAQSTPQSTTAIYSSLLEGKSVSDQRNILNQTTVATNNQTSTGAPNNSTDKIKIGTERNRNARPSDQQSTVETNRFANAPQTSRTGIKIGTRNIDEVQRFRDIKEASFFKSSTGYEEKPSDPSKAPEQTSDKKLK